MIMTISAPSIAIVLIAMLALYVALHIFKLLFSSNAKQTCSYSGEYDSDGRMHGEGRVVASNGDEYVGTFKEGKFHGHGTYTFKHGGGKYVGEFNDGVYHGSGVEIYPDGSRYVGSFSHSRRCGDGRMEYANGDVYIGSWSNGKKHGPGRMQYKDATTFEGHFKQGRRHGVGYITDSKGRKLRGKWIEGKLADQGRLAVITASDDNQHELDEQAKSTTDENHGSTDVTESRTCSVEEASSSGASKVSVRRRTSTGTALVSLKGTLLTVRMGNDMSDDSDIFIYSTNHA